MSTARKKTSSAALCSAPLLATRQILTDSESIKTQSVWGIRAFLALVLWATTGNSASAQVRVISGYVVSAESGEALIGAHVYDSLSGIGSISNKFGFFSLRIGRETVAVRVTHLGYDALELHLAPADSILLLQLVPHSVEMDTVFVVSEESRDRFESIQLDQKVLVKPSDVSVLPALLGEPDLLKVFQLLPGITFGTEGTAGLHVRGGSPDQNLVLIDGAPIYNWSHAFGFASSFNHDALNEAELYKGAAPARFGGRLSSVLNLTTRNGHRFEHRGRASIGLVSSRVLVEGPIRAAKVSYIVSARRSYADLLLRPYLWLKRSDFRLGYSFGDLMAKLSGLLGQRDQVYFSVYASRDGYFLRDGPTQSQARAGLGWGNYAASTRWNRALSPSLYLSLAVLHSRFRYRALDGYTSSEADSGSGSQEYMEARFRSSISDWSATSDLDFNPAGTHQLRLGVSLSSKRFVPGVQRVIERTDSRTVVDSLSYPNRPIDATEWRAYVEDAVDLHERVSVNAGLHTSGFHVRGQRFDSIEPRLTVLFRISRHWTATTSYGRARQYLHLLANNRVGLPTDLWVPSTDRVRPQGAWQAHFGLSRFDRVTSSLAAYYKEMNGVIEYRDGSSLVGLNRDWEAQVASGRGFAYGAEVLAEKDSGPWRGWIGYAVSWANRRIPAINQGLRFPYKYDRRHSVSVVVQHIGGRRRISGTWKLATGEAISLPIAQYRLGESVASIVGRRNSTRLPPYHRLDISVTSTRRGRKSEWTVGVYNLYNRKNALYVFVRESTAFDEVQGYHDHARSLRKLTLFPLLPSVSYGVSW